MGKRSLSNTSIENMTSSHLENTGASGQAINTSTDSSELQERNPHSKKSTKKHDFGRSIHNTAKGYVSRHTTDGSDITTSGVNINFRSKLAIFEVDTLLCPGHSSADDRDRADCVYDNCDHVCGQTGECPIDGKSLGQETTNAEAARHNTTYNASQNWQPSRSEFYENVLSARAYKSRSQFMSCEEINVDPLGNHHITVHMVSSCPREVPQNLAVYKELCETDRLPGSATRRVYTKTHLWMGKTLYKNIYCALCHDDTTSVLAMEPPNYICQDERSTRAALAMWNMIGVEALLSYLTKTCHVYYRIADRIQSVEDIRCDSAVITKCPGQMEDSHTNLTYIGMACNNYKSLVQVKQGGSEAIYKNSHCAFCNGAKPSQLQCYNDTGHMPIIHLNSSSYGQSFVFTMNTEDHNKVNSEYNDHVICYGYEYLDVVNQNCVITHCLLGSVFVAGRCLQLNMTVPTANGTTFKSNIQTLIVVLERKDDGSSFSAEILMSYLRKMFAAVVRTTPVTLMIWCKSFISTYHIPTSPNATHTYCVRIVLDDNYKNSFVEIASNIRTSLANYDSVDNGLIAVRSVVGRNYVEKDKGFVYRNARCPNGMIAYKSVRLIKDTYYYEDGTKDIVIDTNTGAIYDTLQIPLEMVGLNHNINTYALLCEEPVLTCEDAQIYDTTDNVSLPVELTAHAWKLIYTPLGKIYIICNSSHDGGDGGEKDINDTTVVGNNTITNDTISADLISTDTTEGEVAIMDQADVNVSQENNSRHGGYNRTSYYPGSLAMGTRSWHSYDIFSLTCTIISLLSLVVTILTFLILKPLRTMAGFCIRQLCLSVLLMQIVSLVELFPGKLDKKWSSFWKDWAITSGFLWLSVNVQHTIRSFDLHVRCLRSNLIAVVYLFVGWGCGLPVTEIAMLLKQDTEETAEKSNVQNVRTIPNISWREYVLALLAVAICVLNLLQCRYEMNNFRHLSNDTTRLQSGRNMFKFVALFLPILVIHWVLTLVHRHSSLTALAYIHTVLCSLLGVFILFYWTLRRSNLHMLKEAFKKSGAHQGVAHNPSSETDDHQEAEHISLADVRAERTAQDTSDYSECSNIDSSGSHEHDPLAQSSAPLSGGDVAESRC